MLNENDFDFSNDITISKIENQPDYVNAEIVTDVDSIKELSLSALNAQKKALASQKTKVMLSTDERKLQEIEKVNEATDSALEVLMSNEFWEKMKTNAKGPMDFKFLTEGLQKLIDARQRLLRLDSIDAEGTPRKIAIGVRFEDDTGTKVDTVIKVGE